MKSIPSVYSTESLGVRQVPGKGRGVFALKRFKKDAIVEMAPVIYMDEKEKKKADDTILSQYTYSWPVEGESVNAEKWSGGAICLGYGSLYNHSNEPNMVRYHYIEPNLIDNHIRFVALRDIEVNEELTIDYGFVVDGYEFPECE